MSGLPTSITNAVAAHRNDVQVLIVGYGPCGALAAHMLGSKGFSTLVVERQRDVYDKPRAIALDHEIARILDNSGLLDPVRSVIAPFAMSKHFGSAQQLIRTISMVPEPYPLGYTPTMVFSQPPFETAMRAAVARLPTVQVALETTLIALSQTTQGVTATVCDAAGTVRTVTADYLIACDGASSTVRQIIGVALEDLDFDEPWVVVDMLIHPQGGKSLPETSANFCEPERPIVFIDGPANHKRWEIMLKPGEDPALMQQPAQVWKLLSRWISPDEADLWRAASYRFHALVAERWRNGRVFLAGDAAHQQPPILGQGMCQGLRDISNLVWKLERVLRGRSPDTVLDSYGTERRAHARELIFRIKDLGKVLCERDPVAAQARDARLLAEGNGVPRLITRQSVIPSLTGGLIGTGTAAGTLFPQPWVKTGAGPVLMDRVYGQGWRLIARADAGLPDDVVSAFVAAGFSVLHLSGGYQANPAAAVRPVLELDNVLADWFDRAGCDYALIRPDHYVYDTASTLTALPGVLEHLQRQLSGDAALITVVLGE